MANCIDYNCGNLETHLLNDCEEEILGGSDQIIILDCDHQITDPSNGTQVNAELTAGRARLLRNVKFSIEAPSAVTVESNIANRTPKLTNYDRAATLVDGNVNSQNVTFYNSVLNGRSVGGIIVYENGNEEKRVTWIDAAVKMTGGRIFPGSNTEFQRFEVQAQWRKKSEPTIHNAPAGVFS